MSPHVNVRPAAARWPIPWRVTAALTTIAAALTLLGCAQTPPPVSATAANASARAAPVGYRPVLGTYSSARPVEPAPWTGAPKKEGSQ
jgi:hypothetical protein